MFPHVCKKIKLEYGHIPGPKQQRQTQDPKSQAGLMSFLGCLWSRAAVLNLSKSVAL